MTCRFVFRNPGLCWNLPFLTATIEGICLVFQILAAAEFQSILQAPPPHKLQYLQKCTSIISLRYITSNANQHSFTVFYLINSCGLPLKSALSASKRVHFESPERPDSVLHFLKSHGFSKSQITKLTGRYPQLLLSNPEKTLLPRFEFFHSKGISNPDIVQILSICPILFHRNLENHIIPTFNTLSSLFQSTENAAAIIKRYPLILYHDPEGYLFPNVKSLRDNGVPESNILKFLDSWPRISLTFPKFFEKNVAAVKEMGINPSKSQFLLAIKAKIGMSKFLWEEKLGVYKRWGLSDEEILAAFAKYPWCMISSTDKITVAMDFFINEMGWDSSFIAKRPILISLSMEKRIIPRAAVIKFLLSKGWVKTDATSLSTLFLYPEETFIRRLMNSYDEAPKLLKLYKEKLDLSRKTKLLVQVEEMQ